MKKEIADAWVKDLRTNPPQCKGRLYNGYGYCCLGRLVLILGGSFKEMNREYYPVINDILEDDENEILPNYIVNLSGMKTQNGELSYDESLTSMNDAGKTFAQIADVIENRWERL